MWVLREKQKQKHTHKKSLSTQKSIYSEYSALKERWILGYTWETIVTNQWWTHDMAANQKDQVCGNYVTEGELTSSLSEAVFLNPGSLRELRSKHNQPCVMN